MSAWAYRCHPCDENETDWFVSQLDVERLGPDVCIVRVKVDADWKCALLDRTQTVMVENQLLRGVIASNEGDCPQCAKTLAAKSSTALADATESSPVAGEVSAADSLTAEVASTDTGSRTRGIAVNAAPISLRGHRFVVVLVPMTLVTSPGEADMAIDDLQPYFEGVPVVLMAQRDDGSPSYYGDSQLVDMLADIPIEKMAWKEYRAG